jgi:hypothetical protein
VTVVDPVSVNEVLVDGTVLPVESATGLAGVQSQDDIVLVTLTEGLIVSDFLTINATGNLLLQSAAGIDINAIVDAGTGFVSLLAIDDINIATNLMTSGGSVDFLSSAGSIVFSPNVELNTLGGNVRLEAQVDTTVALIDTRTAADVAADTLDDQLNWGSVSLINHTGGLIDADIDPADASPINIFANELRISAFTAIGSLINAIEVEVTTLAAAVTGAALAGNINIQEDTSLALTTVMPIEIFRVGSDATTSSLSDTASLSGLATQVNGSIILNVLSGNLTAVSDVVTSGSGNLLLNVAAGTVDIDGVIQTETGNISVLASGSVALSAASVTRTITGTIDIQSGADIQLLDGSELVSNGGDIRVEAVDNIVLSSIYDENWYLLVLYWFV